MSNKLFYNIPINSRKIDGMQLLSFKFPSLTKRQLNEAYELVKDLYPKKNIQIIWEYDSENIARYNRSEGVENLR